MFLFHNFVSVVSCCCIYDLNTSWVSEYSVYSCCLPVVDLMEMSCTRHCEECQEFGVPVSYSCINTNIAALIQMPSCTDVLCTV